MADRPPGRPGNARSGNPGRKPSRGNWHGKRPHKSATAARRPPPEPSGYAVRALAVRLVSAVLDRRRALDDALATELASPAGAALEPRDRGLARLIAATTLRRKGELEAVIAQFIERPLPDDRGLLTPILLCAAAQLLVLDIAPHAVLNIAVEQCRHDRGARRFDRLANAVLRRVSERGRDILSSLADPRLNAPQWQLARWTATYGEADTRRIVEASLCEAPLDLSAKVSTDAATWAERLGGELLPTGTIRIVDPETRVDALPGFADGAWWVQDAAAALPARLLGDIAGHRVADLCAAPGGKTSQLAAAGANVTAVDASAERLKRVHQNLARLQLTAEIVTADIETWHPPPLFDAVLLDAPCTATGTIRRHPDILHLKRPSDLAPLAALQSRLLDRAAAMLAPGGTLVYCTCSLEPEEGERQIAAFLARNSSFSRVPLQAGEHSIPGDWITPSGDLRTLPHHAPGMDGFYAARLRLVSDPPGLTP